MAGDPVAFNGTQAMFAHLDQLPDPVTVDGVVAPAGDGEHFHFSHSGCGAWTKIPGDIVQSYQPLGKAACGDHAHHRVRLTLKWPAAGTGAFLADLLHHHAATGTDLPGAARLASFAAPGPDANCPQGYYWDAASGTYRCKG